MATGFNPPSIVRRPQEIWMFKLTSITLLALTGLATADTAKAPAKDAKTEAKAPEMPKPPAEIDAMAKTMVGTWKCTGTTSAPHGSSAKVAGKVTAKVDLDKWWLNDVFEGKGDRGAFKTVSFSTFDAASKKWRRVSVDNMGQQYVGTSDGIKDGKVVWNLDFLGAMGAGQFKDTIDPSDPKTGVKFSGLMSVDKGKSWKPVYEMLCKK